MRWHQKWDLKAKNDLSRWSHGQNGNKAMRCCSRAWESIWRVYTKREGVSWSKVPQPPQKPLTLILGFLQWFRSCHDSASGSLGVTFSECGDQPCSCNSCYITQDHLCWQSSSHCPVLLHNHHTKKQEQGCMSGWLKCPSFCVLLTTLSLRCSLGAEFPHQLSWSRAFFCYPIFSPLRLPKWHLELSPQVWSPGHF